MEPTTSNHTRLLERLKSVAILLQPNVTRDDYEPSTDQLLRWLISYDSWFKEAFGIDHGHRLFSLYNREVALFGAEILTLPDKLKNISSSAISFGYAVSITAEITELHKYFSVVQELCSGSLLSSLGVIIEGTDDPELLIPVVDFMNDLINLRRPIGLIGSMSSLRRHGLLSIQSINATDITIYPASEYNNSLVVSLPANPVKPCGTRFRLYVDNDGHIYPCLGLIGLTDYALGHICDDFGITAFASGCYRLDLPKLMHAGPKLQMEVKDQRFTSLPLICEQHRMELLADG